MRRAAILAAVAATILWAGGPALADSVSGYGVAGPYVYFTVNATSGPSGESASGDITLEDEAGYYEGKASQLCASGNTAVVSGAIIGGAPLGYGFILHVQDNADLGTPDFVRWELVAYIPATCPAFAIDPAAKLIFGDLVVEDEVVPPPPPPPVTFEGLTALAVKYVLASGEPGANGIANALTAQLAAAHKAADRGNENAKNGALGAFISTVSNLDRFLTPAQIVELSIMAGML